MNALTKRIAAIEQQRHDLSAMPDDDLRAYAASLPANSREQVAVVMALVGRKGSTLPIIHQDPERQSSHDIGRAVS